MTATSATNGATGYTEAEGYAASLRQMARWIKEGRSDEVDESELCAAANFIERLTIPRSSPDTGALADWLSHYATCICDDERCGRKMLEIVAHLRAGPAQDAVRAAAERVCWFDWSDNDMDAVAAIDALRKAITSSVPSTTRAPYDARFHENQIDKYETPVTSKHQRDGK